MEKEVSYLSKNSYSTLNKLTSDTKNVWFVCHGIGYLSKHFLKYFNELNQSENYIIAPQAPSKYYLGKQYKYVGASWLTRENTESEIDNLMNYLDAVLESEQIPGHINKIFFGFSQGVSIITRFVAIRKISCDQLVLFSGGIPKELTDQHFNFLKGMTKVSMIYGTEDELLTNDKLVDEKRRFYELFGNQASMIPFYGKHEVNKRVIEELISN